jgi:hypothetical protein
MRKFTALAAVAAASFALAAPAQAADTTTAHVVDHGKLLVASTVGTISGTYDETLTARGRRLVLDLYVSRTPMTTGCLFARVVINGGFRDSTPACGPSSSQVVHLVREAWGTSSYAIELRRKARADSTTSTVLGRQNYRFGPDADRSGWLDRDPFSVVTGGRTAFLGHVGYGDECILSQTQPLYPGNPYSTETVTICYAWAQKAKIIGDLAWTGTFGRTSAKITWTYADGTTSSWTSPSVGAGEAPLRIRAMSDRANVWRVRMTITTVSRATVTGSASGPILRFGDFYGI